MYSRPEKGGEEDCSAGTYLAYRGMRSVQGELRLDRLQPPDLESRCKLKRVFGRFVAREAMLEEELWVIKLFPFMQDRKKPCKSARILWLSFVAFVLNRRHHG